MIKISSESSMHSQDYDRKPQIYLISLSEKKHEN